MVRRPQTDVGYLCTDQLTEQPERSGLFPEAVAGAHWWCRQPTVESGVDDLRRLLSICGDVERPACLALAELRSLVTRSLSRTFTATRAGAGSVGTGIA